MEALVEYLEQLTRRITLYDYTGTKEQLHTLAGNLAGFGIRVETAETEQASPTDVAVLHQNGEVLDAFSVETLERATDFERPLDEEQLSRHSVVDDLAHDVTIKTALTVQEMVRVSREFERRAIREGTGTIHAGFQHISQLAKSEQTMELYQSLGSATDVDVYIYGYPDVELDQTGFTVVEDSDAEIERYWFLLYDGGGNPDRKAALVSKESPGDTSNSSTSEVLSMDDRHYRSYFTTNPETVNTLFQIAEDEGVLATAEN